MLVEIGICHFQTWLLKISFEILNAFPLTPSSGWMQWIQWKTLRFYRTMDPLLRSWLTKWTTVYRPPLVLLPLTRIAWWHALKVNVIVPNLWVTIDVGESCLPTLIITFLHVFFGFILPVLGLSARFSESVSKVPQSPMRILIGVILYLWINLGRIFVLILWI